jgi:hypothetical protein
LLPWQTVRDSRTVCYGSKPANGRLPAARRRRSPSRLGKGAGL